VKDVKNSNNSALLVVLLFGLIGLGGFCSYLMLRVNNTPKIAVVDNQFLVSQFSEAIVARKAFDQEKVKWENNLKAIQDTLDTIVKTMSTTYSKATPALKSEMESKLNHYNSEYRRYLKAVDQLAVNKEKELMGPVLDQLNAFVKTWAKQNGYEVVIGSANGGVILTVSEKYNVTDEILADLNKMYQSKSPIGKSGQTDTGKSSEFSKGVPGSK
jgi:outer membrane protein